MLHIGRHNLLLYSYGSIIASERGVYAVLSDLHLSDGAVDVLRNTLDFAGKVVCQRAFRRSLESSRQGTGKWGALKGDAPLVTSHKKRSASFT